MKSKLVLVFVVLLLVGVYSSALARYAYFTDGTNGVYRIDTAPGSATEQIATTPGASAYGIVIDPNTGNLLVSNGPWAKGEHQLLAYSKTGTLLDNGVLAGTLPGGYGTTGLAFDSSGRLYVTDNHYDWVNDAVLRYTYNSSTGKYDSDDSWKFTTGIPGPGDLAIGPGTDGHVWTSMEGGYAVVAETTQTSGISSNGTRYYTDNNTGAYYNGGLAVSPNGQYLYMNNYGYANGMLKLEIGVDTGFTTPGSLVLADALNPLGMAIDESGNIYVADSKWVSGYGFRIRVLTGADSGAPVHSYDLQTRGNGLYGIAVETIPEPGSLLALGAGMAGMMGFIIRRRK